MFLEKVFDGKNEIGRWIAMIILVVVFTQLVGALPLALIIGIAVATDPDIEPNLENPLDFSVYGIDQIESLALMIIPFILGLAALWFLHKPIHERPALSMITGAPKFRWKRYFWAIGVWLAIFVLYSLVTTLCGMQKIELQFDPSRFYLLILVSVLLLPFQTGFEEFFFRGYLMQGVANLSRNRWVPLLVTSIIFGGLHYFNPEVKEYGAAVMLPQYIWFGLFFGICAIFDDGLELAWGTHTINNIFLSVFFTQDASALQTPALFRVTDYDPLIDFFGLMVMSLLFIFLAKRSFNWPSWNYLLEKIHPSPDQEEEEEFYEEEDEYANDEE